jgi:hypothetical protein
MSFALSGVDHGLRPWGNAKRRRLTRPFFIPPLSGVKQSHGLWPWLFTRGLCPVSATPRACLHNLRSIFSPSPIGRGRGEGFLRFSQTAPLGGHAAQPPKSI